MLERMKKILLVSTCTSALLVGGCTATTGEKQTVGTVIGAVAGGVVGSQIGNGSCQLIATGVGTLIGALIGNEVGATLDKVDQQHVLNTTHQSLEYSKTGATTSWNNPDTGNSGNVKTLNTYKAVNNQYCREYQTEVTVGGRTQSAYGTACRRPDGTWEIIK